MKTAVVVDSASNYYTEGTAIEGLFAIPLQIIDGDKTYLESTEISIHEVNSLMANGKMLKTSLPALGLIESLFKEIKDEGYDQILAIPITSGISGTIGAMNSAANFLEIPFDYFDCYSAAYVELYCAITARGLLDEGKSISEVKETLNSIIHNSSTYIIPNDLTHLSRGGRLSPLAAKLGGFLRIKPILYLNESTSGIIEPFDKVRTMSKAVDAVVQAMIDNGVDETYQIVIVDVDNNQELELAHKKFKAVFPNNEIKVTSLISTVGVHVGIGALAFQYYKKII